MASLVFSIKSIIMLVLVLKVQNVSSKYILYAVLKKYKIHVLIFFINRSLSVAFNKFILNAVDTLSEQKTTPIGLFSLLFIA